jgi:multicomponent Na+:H+ antiporter subunit D
MLFDAVAYQDTVGLAAEALRRAFPGLVLIPLGAAMLSPIVAFRSVKAARFFGGLSLAANLFLSLVLANLVWWQGTLRYKFGGWSPPWGIEIVLDPMSAMMAPLVAFFALLAFASASRCEEKWTVSHAGAFQGLYLLLAAGLMGIVVTGDLFNLYVFLEISSLSAYALVAAGGDRGKVAAFRYLIIGSVAATFWVLGVGYLYALTGTLNMADLSTRLPAVMGSRAAVAGLAFIVAGLAIKMALFPLHGWQPDAYTYAPPGAMPFISAVMAKVSAYALFRVLYDVFQKTGPAAQALEVLAWLAALSIVAGSLLALGQRDVRRMLAYSSVAQIGYVVLGFGIGNAFAATGALLHIVNHAVMKSCCFSALGAFRARTGRADVDGLAGLGKTMPWTAAAFTVAALGIIGIPPTCGFFSKFYLIRGAIQAGAWHFVAVFAVSSILSTVYFFRVIESLYLRKPEKDAAQERPPVSVLAPALVLAGLILALGVFNQNVLGTFVPEIVTAGGS